MNANEFDQLMDVGVTNEVTEKEDCLKIESLLNIKEATVEKINIKGYLEMQSKENLVEGKQPHNKCNRFYNIVIILTSEDQKYKIGSFNFVWLMITDILLR